MKRADTGARPAFIRSLIAAVILLLAAGCDQGASGKQPIEAEPAPAESGPLATGTAIGSVHTAPVSTTPDGTDESDEIPVPQAQPDHPVTVAPSTTERSPMLITEITDNSAVYEGGAVPQYEKLEITFQIEGSVAQNLQFPFDPSPPPGIDPADPAYQGISVNAIFSPDGWQTIFAHPGFIYYDYLEDVVDGRDWIYPTGGSAWKVRFAPHVPGRWQYRLVAEDASGFAESEPFSFEVGASANHGFVNVSQTDPRYFEFDDGEHFLPLGFNRGLSFADPVTGNGPMLARFQQNGIQLIRSWISGIYGSAWLEWLGGRNLYNGYLPRPGILPFQEPESGELSMALRIDYEPEGDQGWFDGCRFQFWNDPEGVKQDTPYRLSITYWGQGIEGPRRPGSEAFGLVGKMGGGWNVNCYEPGVSTVITGYGQDSDGWTTIEGAWFSGEQRFLPKIYIGLENVTRGTAYVRRISLREELGDGRLGPEVIVEPSMQYEQYFPETQALALDKMVTLAESNGVYLKLVIQDKNDVIFYKINDDGSFVTDEGDNLDGFYGVWRDENKTRWLQKAWWRYLQARWGYSTSVHSWELTNEGDPWNGNHWALADELGRYMHCTVFGLNPAPAGGGCGAEHPNAHLVSTSFWHSFPANEFWANADFPDIDYVDVHAYISTGWRKEERYESDTALFHLEYSAEVRGSLDDISDLNGIPTKPVMRGETGIDFLNQQQPQPDLAMDENGVWLHNLLWSTLDPGGMSEFLWWMDEINNQPGPDGAPGLFEIFRYFSEFMADIPLSNGYYEDASALLSDPNLRSTGQKDALHGQAHLWVQNRRHIWRNVVEEVAGLSGMSGTAVLDGFAPLSTFEVSWYLFDTGGLPKIETELVTSDEAGTIKIDLPDDQSITDAGMKMSILD